MLTVRTSRIVLCGGVVFATAGAVASAHQVTGVRVEPLPAVAGEPVTLTVEGRFSDGCERSTSATAIVEEHRITIFLHVVGPPAGAACPEVLTPFEQSIELAGPASGYYRIDVELIIREFGEQRTESFPSAGELFVHAGRIRYQLLPESWFMDDCPVCGRPSVQLPMTGTFDLLVIGPGAIFNFYRIDNVKFEAEGFEISGTGEYQFSVPQLGGQQHLRLDVTVNKEAGITLESGLTSMSETAPFPEIAIQAIEETPSIARVYIIHIVAAPLPPRSDFDYDGDVDLTDFQRLQQCVTGPELGPPSFECAAADLDRDQDVDQSDFGLFQRCYSGVDTPADPSCEL